ncbi:hypothetical protein ACFSC4_18425 [Deinococcus malanensis]|uniref:hypothetical protein n=1 Tax=Deinococcus malanensis TaxID=1706855 RepID=UPI00362E38A8
MTLENGPVSLYVRTNYRKLGWNEAVRMTSLGTALMIWPLLKLGPSHRDESLSYFPADLREQVVDESTLEPDLLAELRTVETDLQALGFERVACSTDRQSVVKGVNAVAAMHLRHPSRHLVAFVGCARKTAGGFQTYTSVGAWDAGAVFYGITNQPPWTDHLSARSGGCVPLLLSRCWTPWTVSCLTTGDSRLLKRKCGSNWLLRSGHRCPGG